MKNLATLRNSYKGIRQARNQWAQAIIENLKEMGKEIKVLGDYYDPEDGWPEGLHIVIMDDDNYPQDIVIDSVKYEEKECSNIAVHLCYWDPNKCDQWWSISDFSSDDADTILLAIQWPESVKQGEAQANEIEVLFAVDSEDNTKQAICATSEANWQDGSKREAIDKAVRDFLGDILTEYIEDPYEAHINDKSEDEKKAEFDETISKLASGLSEDFLWYEFYWETVTEIK